MKRFPILLSAGALLACIVGVIWGALASFIPDESKWIVIGFLLVVGGVLISIGLNRR